jgi:integrase/recombinase XerD
MAYQYVREPLKQEDADKLTNACETTQEKLVVWPLLDRGLDAQFQNVHELQMDVLLFHRWQELRSVSSEAAPARRTGVSDTR